MIFTTSWDDGNELDFKLLEALKTFRVKGTLYIPIQCKYRTLSNTEIISLSKYFEIGSHSMTHPDLTSCSYELMNFEISKSKVNLENLIDCSCPLFCYPYGKYTKKSSQFVAEHYKAARIVTPEFSSGVLVDNIHLQTTMQVCNHTVEMTKYLNSKVTNFGSIKNRIMHKIENLRVYGTNRYRWIDIAFLIFAELKRINGIFHLWGHSWEIESQMLWGELNDFIQFISNDPDIIFLNNNQVFGRLKDV